MMDSKKIRSEEIMSKEKLLSKLNGIYWNLEFNENRIGDKMRTKKYFKSTCDWNKRRDDMNFLSYAEAKRMAYNAAIEGIKNEFSVKWANKYINNIPPESKFWWYEETIREYADYLNGVKTQDEANAAIDEIEKKWNDLNEMCIAMFSFNMAASEAFKREGIEFGDVEFTCPNCGGKARAGRYNTPNNIAHKVTIREYCEGCGHTSMN